MRTKKIAAVVVTMVALLLITPAAALATQSGSSPLYYDLTDDTGIEFNEQEVVYYQLPGGYVHAVETEAYINNDTQDTVLNCMLYKDDGGTSSQQHSRYSSESLTFNNTPTYVYGSYYGDNLNWIQGNYVTFAQEFAHINLCSGSSTLLFGGVIGQLTINQGWNWSPTYAGP